MHMQAPTLTTTTRQPMFVVVAALLVAAIVAGAIALATRDDSSTSAIAPAAPALVQSAQTRDLDGSPLLRTADPALPHSGGLPSVQPTAEFPARPPEGFHRTP